MQDRYIKMKLIAVLLMAAFTGKASAQSLEEKMHQYISSYQGVSAFSGVVLVSSDDSILFQRAYAMANYEWNIPNTLNTKFRIASLSKSFTAALVMQMVEQNRIRLDATISEYMPDYPSSYKDSITIRQLLTHTSGIPHYDAVRGFDPDYTRLPITAEKYIKLIAGLNIVFRPGTGTHYSSFGYYILGVILERVSGMPFSELLKRNILIPAGLTATSFDDMASIQSNRASGYNIDHRGLINCSFEDTQKSTGSGGIISTAGDLCRWSSAIQSGKIVTKMSTDLIFSKDGSFGYGWVLGEQKVKGSSEKQLFAFHGGSDFGFASYIYINLTSGKVVIVLSNLESAPVEKIARDVYCIMMGEDVKNPVVRKNVPVSREVYSKFTGSYQVAPDYLIDIYEEKFGLSIQWTGLKNRLLLFPAADEKYFIRENNKEFTFNRDAGGEVVSLSFPDGEYVIKALKLN